VGPKAASPRRGQLFLAAASALFLELVFLRWIGSEAPVLAYFKNFPLLAAFLGMGAGARLAHARVDLTILAPLALGLLGLGLACSGPLGLDLRALTIPDPYLDHWAPALEAPSLASTLGLGLVLIALLAAGFVALGQSVGRLLDEAGPRLESYGLDLAGGLLGVTGALAASALPVPPAWLAGFGLMGFSLAAGRRRVLFLSVLFALLVPATSAGLERGRDVTWSPYYRIEIEPHVVRGVAIGERLTVNHDLHQVMLDLSDESEQAHPSIVDPRRRPYALPYLAPGVDASGKSVIVAGAGTGNDVAEALRRGAGRVTALELDPAIAALGRTRHPEHPYQAANVHLVADDARAALRRLRGAEADLLVYGLLDAHASLAAFGSLRHEYYVYTVEGIEAGLAALGSSGVASLTFFEGDRHWLGDRLAATVARAEGRPPVVTTLPGQGHVFLFFGPGLDRDATRARLETLGLADEAPVRLAARSTPTTDDWPFLYLNPGGPPVIYLTTLVTLVLLTVGAVALASRLDGSGGSGRDAEMVLLGAAFLLVETKAIADLARSFGATWVVTGLVLVGIFFVLSLVNAIARRLPGKAAPWFGVAAALGLLLPRVLPLDLEALPPLSRALAAVAITGLPIGLAGIAFSLAFARVEPGKGGRALGANLAGAAVGGGLEALALAFGLGALTLVAAGLYVAWAIVHARGRRE
jgi:hypothetical protein